MIPQLTPESVAGVVLATVFIVIAYRLSRSPKFCVCCGKLITRQASTGFHPKTGEPTGYWYLGCPDAPGDTRRGTDNAAAWCVPSPSGERPTFMGWERD